MATSGFVRLNGLVSRSSQDACTLIHTQVTGDLLNLIASTEVKFTYKINEQVATQFDFLWPAWNIPDHATVLINESVIVDIKREVIVELDEIPSLTPKSTPSKSKPVWKKEGLDYIKLDMGFIGGESKVIVILQFVEQVQLVPLKPLASSKNQHQMAISYTLPSGLSYSHGFPAGNSSLPETRPPNANEEFRFDGFINMPVAIDQIDVTPAENYIVKYASGKRNTAQVSPKVNSLATHGIEMRIVLRASPQLFAFSEPHVDIKNTTSAPIDCLAVNFVPDLSNVSTEIGPKTELVLLIDRSKRVSESVMQSFSDALLLFVKSLSPEFRFQVIGFGTLFETLFISGSADYTNVSISRALRYREGLKNDMGLSNFYPALRFATEFSSPGKSWHRQIITLLGGDIWDPSEVINLLAANTCRTRTFLVGVGSTVDAAAISSIANAGHAIVSHVPQEGQLCQVLASILNQAVRPRVDNIELQLDCPRQSKEMATTTIIPRSIPTVHCGQFMTAMLITPKDVLPKLRGKLHMAYSILDEKRTISIDLKEAGSHLAQRKTECQALHHLADRLDHLEQYRCSEDTVTLPSPSMNHKEIVQEEIQPQREPNSLVHAEPPGKRDRNKKVKPVRSSAKRSTVCGCFPRRQKNQKDNTSSTAPRAKPRGKQIPLKPGTIHSDKLVSLVQMQEIDGSWSLVPEITQCMGIGFDSVTRDVPKIDLTKQQQVWATAIVLGYFRLATESSDWSLSTQKAKQWLLNQFTDANPDRVAADDNVEDLIGIAQIAIRSGLSQDHP